MGAATAQSGLQGCPVRGPACPSLPTARHGHVVTTSSGEGKELPQRQRKREKGVRNGSEAARQTRSCGRRYHRCSVRHSPGETLLEMVWRCRMVAHGIIHSGARIIREEMFCTDPIPHPLVLLKGWGVVLILISCFQIYFNCQ